MERLHHPTRPARALEPVTSASDLAAIDRSTLTEHLLPRVANILGTRAVLGSIFWNLLESLVAMRGTFVNKTFPEWFKNI